MFSRLRMRISVVFAAAILSFCAGCASDGGKDVSDARRGPIEGTFIQYQDWMMKMDARAWRRELDAMRRAGLRLVIIQWLQTESSRFIPDDTTATDPTRVILEYADAHDMRVFVGLAYADFWWKRINDVDYLAHTSVKNMRLADEVWKRYGRHRSFAGWYFPQELRDANYPSQHFSRIRDFLKQLGDHCRALSGGKPVSMAPAVAGLETPDVFRDVYISILMGSGVDILIFQDGVGARDWGADLEERITPYFRAMRAACDAAGVEMWADTEVFHHRGGPSRSEPATIDRIKRQLAAESPFVKSFVMFDFFHYMSPYRGGAQKKLYKDYLRELTSPADSSR